MMTTDAVQGVLIGGTGLATLVALIYFLMRSESRKMMDKNTYRREVRPSFLAFLSLELIFGTALLLAIESYISLPLLLGLLILFVGVVMQYYRPLGLTKRGIRHVPNWEASLIIGVVMIIAGALTLLLIPIQSDSVLRLVPLGLIGLGLLTIFVSIVSFRETALSKRNAQQ